MSRTALFRKLQWLLRVSEEADRRDLPSGEAVDMAHARQLWRPTRREVIAAASASIALVATTPGLAAAKPTTTAATVAVVGGGLAGLGCVDMLRARRIGATLYEASTRLGGRCRSMGGGFAGPVAFDGQVVERGGETIDTLHQTMRGWAREFGLNLELAEGPGETIFHANGSAYSEADVVAEFRALVDALRDDLRTVGSPTGASWTQSDRRLDELDLASYLQNRGAGALIAAILESAYRGEFGLEISEQSALNLLLFVHADRRSKFRPFGIFSDERFHVIGGNEQIVNGLAARNAAAVQLGHRLLAVAETSSGQVKLTFDSGGGAFDKTFDRVVLALPFSVLRDVDLSGFPLPDWKRRAINELRYGSSSKHMVGFTGQPWRAAGKSGAMYADLDNLQVVWETNQSLANSGRAVLTDYMGGTRGLTIDPLQVQPETALFLNDLGQLVSGASTFARRDSGANFVAHIENWSDNPFAKGGYSTNHPGYFTTICDFEAPPVRALHFAGEHTASFYGSQGFMEGAAVSGVRAAREVQAALK